METSEEAKNFSVCTNSVELQSLMVKIEKWSPKNPRGFRGSLENVGYRTVAFRNLETDSRKSSPNCVCDEILRVIGRYFEELCRLDFSDIHGFLVPPNQIATLGTFAELKLKLNQCIL